MENNTEVLEPQKIPEVVEPQSTNKETLSEKEIEDLKHKAEVSSQNFERAKKAEAELKELRELQDNPILSDEDEIVGLKTELSDIKKKLSRSEVLEMYPQLKDSWNDLEAFREQEENKGMNLKTAAKAFLVEKGLLEPQRKGLEKPTGGQRPALNQTENTEEIKKLRETDFKKYREMLKKGQIKVS